MAELARIMAVSALALATSACAQTGERPFPSARPITLIVPYAAGGTTDATARILARELEARLGTPVRIANRPGAASQIAMTELATSEPDGYTLSYAVLPTVINHYLDPARDATYTLADFQPIAQHWVVPGMIAVAADGPYRTLDDLIAAARAEPGRVTVSDSGMLGNPHLMVLMLENASGIDLASVHFDGGAPSLTALLGGHVSALAGGVSDAVARVRSGDLRVLGIAGEEESPSLGSAPTMASLGYDVVAVSAAGIVAPAGTPPAVVHTLSEAIERIVTSEKHREELRQLGDITPRYLAPAAYRDAWTEHEARLGPLLEEIRSE